MSHKGLWINEKEFLRFEDGTKPETDSLTAEIATRGRSIDFFSVGNMYLPNPDPVLKANGKDIQVYTDLMVDDRVGGGMINRINATLALDWEIDRNKGSKSRQAKIIKSIFDKLPINKITESIIRNARGYGYAPHEIIMTRKDGLNVPVDIVGKPQRWFVFSQENELRFLSRTNMLNGEELPPRRFICPTNEASYDNPYGMALNARCFWPVVFKKGGWRFWVGFSEKYGAVWPIGKLPRSASKEQIDDFMDILVRMVNDGAAVIPDDGSVDLKESASKGASADLFGGLIKEGNSAISTVWLGHAGAGQSVSGTMGGEETAAEVRKDLRDADKALVEEAMNQVIDFICEENWGSSAGAPRFCLWEEDDVDLPQAERDEKLAEALALSGQRLSRTYFLRTYNLQDDDLEAIPAAPAEPAALVLPNFGGRDEYSAVFPSCPHCSSTFAESGQDAIDRISDQSQNRKDADSWPLQIRKHIEQARDLVTALRTLPNLRNNISIDAAAQTLGAARVLAHLTGRSEVLDEVAGKGAQFVQGEPLPFDQAIDFFRRKLNVKSETWTDLWQGEHSRGFTIAGAMRDEMLEDFREAIEQAITQGTTYQTFLQEFDRIVEKFGWSYNGGRRWRSRVIYDTNVSTSYNAGRWAQLTDPDLLKTNPYLEYRHVISANPRQMHVSWDKTILPASDPWWNTHYTPNGWGCKCKVMSAGTRELKAQGKSAPDKAPDNGTYQWPDPKTGKEHTVPIGIDPGWAYNPGKSWLNPVTGKLEKL